jgi:F420-0:gamma-glutamyl ligase
MRTVGTVARGIRAPLVKEGDNIIQIVVNSVLSAAKEECFALKDKDVVGITEAVVARAQGNYATNGQIAEDIQQKFPDGILAITFPILSRNRFSNILKGIVQGCSKLYIMLSYPADEVGNELVSWEALDKAGINPYSDVLTEEMYREKLGYETKHVFTNLDYVEYYKSFGEHIEIIFSNDVRSILKFTKNVLCCDVHTRERSKRLLKEAGAEIVFGLEDVLSQPVKGSGYNELYGLLGSNKATEDLVKLFPRDCESIINQIAQKFKDATGKQIEVMIYGDGAFKDPVGKIWELADPVVSPAFTPGLQGTPNELKLKFLLDNEFVGKDENEIKEAMDQAIKLKDINTLKDNQTVWLSAPDSAVGSQPQLKDNQTVRLSTPDSAVGSQPRMKDISFEDKFLGTTPRRYTDLLGSLCDLVSGSGDKGTPIVLVQGYFDNYAS